MDERLPIPPNKSRNGVAVGGPMACPECDHRNTGVTDSRPVLEGARIRRRRVCTNCRYRFTTYEIRAEDMTDDLLTLQRKAASFDALAAIFRERGAG